EWPSRGGTSLYGPLEALMSDSPSITFAQAVDYLAQEWSLTGPEIMATHPRLLDTYEKIRRDLLRTGRQQLKHFRSVGNLQRVKRLEERIHLLESTTG